MSTNLTYIRPPHQRIQTRTTTRTLHDLVDPRRRHTDREDSGFDGADKPHADPVDAMRIGRRFIGRRLI